MAPGLPSLRGFVVFPAVFRGLQRQRAAVGHDFRVIAFSVQDDHVHLIVEAKDKARLAAGARALGIRLAHAVNGVLGRRGRVIGDRYHVRTLRTPREVKFALVYVLQNFKKHQPHAPTALDPCSSAAWFDGFRDAIVSTDADTSPTHPPRTWLLRLGWRRYGLLSPHDRPS